MRPRDAPHQRKKGVLCIQGERGEEEANTNPRPYYFSPSDTLRAGFLAARGVLSRWYSSLPVRLSASCAASRVFLGQNQKLINKRLTTRVVEDSAGQPSGGDC